MMIKPKWPLKLRRSKTLPSSKELTQKIQRNNVLIIDMCIEQLGLRMKDQLTYKPTISISKLEYLWHKAGLYICFPEETRTFTFTDHFMLEPSIMQTTVGHAFKPALLREKLRRKGYVLTFLRVDRAQDTLECHLMPISEVEMPPPYEQVIKRPRSHSFREALDRVLS